ncbi:hypothetical protein VTH82DRAFT_109 [Thermothelomyces myriococcoides]
MIKCLGLVFCSGVAAALTIHTPRTQPLGLPKHQPTPRPRSLVVTPWPTTQLASEYAQPRPLILPLLFEVPARAQRGSSSF